MTDPHRPAARAAAALLVSFGLGVWFGSEKTVRRIRHLSDPENRKWFVEEIKDAKRKRRARRKSHPLRQLLR